MIFSIYLKSTVKTGPGNIHKGMSWFKFLVMQIILITLLLISLLPEAAGSDDPSAERNYISYSVSNNSWMSLSGTTNINTFECFSEEGATGGSLLADVEAGNNKVKFSDAGMMVSVNSFDCKNPLINRDLYRSFGGGDNTEIDIKLIDAGLNEGELAAQKGSFKANALVSINGITKPVELQIQWNNSGGMEYHFKGEADMTMSDFGIKPPSPMMGLIKVDDVITIRFNYVVRPNVISRLD